MFKKLVMSAAILGLGFLFITAPVVEDTLGIAKKPKAEVNKTEKDPDLFVDENVAVSKTTAKPLPKIELVRPKNKQVRKLTLSSTRTVQIFGQISFNSLQVADKITDLASQSSDPIYLLISSPGGSVIAGSAIISAIQAAKAPVYTVCYAFCASMGAIIHQYGTRRYATDRSVIMFHPASARVGGNIDQIYRYTSSMMKYISKIEIEVSNRLKWGYKTYKHTIANELWLDSDEAKTYNVIDQIVYTRTSGFTYGNGNLFNNKTDKELKVHSKDLIWMFRGNL